MSRSILASLGAALRQRSFVVAFLLLLVAAIGLNASVQFLKLHFKKESVPMRMKFAEVMPEVLGSWVRIAKDDTIDADILASLATNEFLFCSYVDAGVVGRSPEDLANEIKKLSYEDQVRKREEYRIRYPTALVSLALTYYTGKADTVAHIPERCYVADGFEPVSPETVRWNPDEPLDVRYITFEGQTLRSTSPINVAYCFHVNGDFTADSLAVRAALQNLFARYGYYAKIELRSDSGSREDSARTMEKFLVLALPRIKSALPDWRQYQGR
jgi:hypothetical protein